MLLAIDVGNTQIVVGLFSDDGSVGTGELAHHWRVATHPVYTADEFALQLMDLLSLDGMNFSAVTGAVISCVVPPLQVALRQMTSKRIAAPSVFVEPGVRTGMPVLVDNPKEVGADRIADAVAAFERYGGPTIVVDFGTATNFEVVSAKGEYLGGVLFPGVEVSLDALAERAALLPRVDFAPPGTFSARTPSSSFSRASSTGLRRWSKGSAPRSKTKWGRPLWWPRVAWLPWSCAPPK